MPLMFEDNTIRLELPLKYPETIRITFIPDVPGPLTIEIIPSTCTTTRSPETPKEKGMCTYFFASDVAEMFLALPQHQRTFIGPGTDNSPAKPPVPTTPIGNVVFHPPTTPIADIPAPDDSVTEPESEVEPGTVAADKTVVNTSTGIKPRCYCKSYGCNGTLIPVGTRRTHDHADLRRTLQSTIHSGRVIPYNLKTTHLEPVPRVNPITAPLIPPIFDFLDPPPVSPCAVEQQMLDHGMLTQEDIDIQIHGRALPNLGPNFHTPEVLIDALDFYDAYNDVTAAGAQPLDAHRAHSLPKDPEQRELEKLLEEEMQKMDTDGEEDQDVDVDMADIHLDEDLVDEDIAADVVQPPPDNNEDTPDPFKPDDDFFMSHGNRAMSTIPPHLLTIYAVTTWLHLQWHLPCAASRDSILHPTVSYTCASARYPLLYPSLLSNMLRAWFSYPYLPLSVQIQSILTIPGVEATLDGWRAKPRTPGRYMDIFDGDMCHLNLKAPDGRLFFSNGPNKLQGPDKELHLGINLGIDWFSYICSNIVPSHSSCPTSFSICNLPPEYRYHTSNLMCTSILPELCPEACWITQADKTQAAAFVKDAFKEHTNMEQQELGERYQQLTTPTARKNFVKDFATCYTQLARLPYFDLVNQVMIDPMHNLFLGLVKTHFYNIWVQGKFTLPSSCGKLPNDIGMPSGGSLTADQWLLLSTVYSPIVIPQLWSACLPSTESNQILQDRVAQIERLETEKTRQAEKKMADQRALEEAKKQGKEAHALEKARIAKEKELEATAKNDVRLKAAATKQADKVRLAAEKKAEKARISTEKKAARHRKKATEAPPSNLNPQSEPLPTFTSTADNVPPSEVPPMTDAGDEGEEELKFGLHPDDPANFLKLSAALRILMRHTLSDADIDSADTLIQQYLYGSNIIKPNHHYATHIASFVRNFGPLHDFWTFLFEHLNKVLKSFKTNNHANRELETTFFSEFHQTCESSRLLVYQTYALLRMPKESLPCEVAEHMLKASAEERGTVAALAALSKELDEVNADAGEVYALSPRHQPVISHSIPLRCEATFFDYVVIKGKQYYASHMVGYNSSSLVHAVMPDLHGEGSQEAYGEVLEVFQLDQDIHFTGESMWFAHMQWFKPWNGSSTGWEDL
ncbi:hypothetical protein BDR06DRAFT_977775 [Suillus hirtellus]|nr:hypothetical protein BDR06DRAFT_977775 [Suillus hirtellus]